MEKEVFSMTKSKEIEILNVVAEGNGNQVEFKKDGKQLEVNIYTNFEGAKTADEVLKFKVENVEMNRREFYNFISGGQQGKSSLLLVEEELNNSNHKKMLAFMDEFSDAVQEVRLLNKYERFEKQIVVKPETVRRVRVDFVNDIGLKSFFLKTEFVAEIVGKEFKLEYARQWDDQLYVIEDEVQKQESCKYLINHINAHSDDVAFTQNAKEFEEEVVKKVMKMIK